MSPSRPLLEGRDLRRVYRLGRVEVPAVDGVTLAVEAGDFLVLEGPSGSGKTTLLNLLGLLDRPDGGTLLWEGRAVGDLDEDALSELRRDRLGFVFQTFNLVPVLSAAENVELPMALAGVAARARRERSLELLAAVGLADRAAVRPDLLSGGQRQRVAIARALANDARLLLADEPTGNLDSHSAEEVLDLLERLHEERGMGCVIATHDPRVRARASRVLHLIDGRLEAAA
ncbi:MAG: ABC transporter ATP-binding protein [Thermoanaerobaculia bacterium]